APLFSDPWNAVVFVWLLSSGLFGALTIVPTYGLAKEAFGRKAGLVSAFLLAISVGNLQRSASTDADHDAFTLFFVVATFYFFLRALKTMNRRRWVENWFRRDAITSGVRAFVRENRSSVLYALFAGLSVTVIALAWQGWACGGSWTRPSRAPSARAPDTSSRRRSSRPSRKTSRRGCPRSSCRSASPRSA